MVDRVTILPREPSTPAAAPARRKRFTLPPQQLAKARSRLSFLTLLFACMCIFAIAIEWIFKEFYPYGIYPLYVFNGITSILMERLMHWLLHSMQPRRPWRLPTK